jgi:hypothetical protein
MVGFVGASLLAILMSLYVIRYAKRRPAGSALTWGEAMVAATYVFFLLFWVYGVVPHQFLTWVQNELKWRSDAIVVGHGAHPWGPLGFLKQSPIVMSKQTVGDILVVGIYGIGLTGHVLLWSIWQNRGKQKAVEVETSRYGRPLVKA